TTVDSIAPPVAAAMLRGIEIKLPMQVFVAIMTIASVAPPYAQADSVSTWGFNDAGQLGNGTTVDKHSPVAVANLSAGVTAVAAGHGHSLAIQNGALYVWGSNYEGGLGDGSGLDQYTPVPVPGMSSGVTAIAAGTSYSLTIKNGGLFAWGSNTHGKL